MSKVSRLSVGRTLGLAAAVNLILSAAALAQSMPTSGVVIDPTSGTPVTYDGSATPPSASVLSSQVNIGGTAAAVISSTGWAPFSGVPFADVLALAATPTDSAAVGGTSVVASASMNQQGALIDASSGASAGTGLGYANYQAITADGSYATLQASVGSQGAPVILLASNPSASPVAGELSVQGNAVGSIARGNTTTVSAGGRTVNGITITGSPTVGAAPEAGTTSAQAELGNLNGSVGSAAAQGGVAIAGLQVFSSVASDGGVIASQLGVGIPGVYVDPSMGGVVASTDAQFAATTPLSYAAAPVVVADNTASAQFQGNQAQYAYAPNAGAVLQSSVAIAANQTFVGTADSGLPGGYIAQVSAQFDANAGGKDQFGALIDASAPVSGLNLTVAGNTATAQATANTLAVSVGSQNAPASLFGSGVSAPNLGVAADGGAVGGLQYDTNSGVAVVEASQTLLSASMVANNESSSFSATANLNGRLTDGINVNPGQVDLTGSTLMVSGNSATAAAQGNALQVSANVAGTGNSLGLATLTSQDIANSAVIAQVINATFDVSASGTVDASAGTPVDGLSQIGTVAGAGTTFSVNANSVGASAVGNSVSETVLATAPTGSANVSTTVVQNSGGDSSTANSLAGGGINTAAPVTVAAFVYDPTFRAVGMAGDGSPSFAVTNNTVSANAVTNQGSLMVASGSGVAAVTPGPLGFNAVLSQGSVGGTTESVVSAQFLAAADEVPSSVTGLLGTGMASVLGNSVVASATVNQGNIGVGSPGVAGNMLSGVLLQNSTADTVLASVVTTDPSASGSLLIASGGASAAVAGNSVAAQAVGNQATLVTTYGLAADSALGTPTAYNTVMQGADQLNASATINAPIGGLATSQTGTTSIDSNQMNAVVQGNAATVYAAIGTLVNGSTVTNDLTQTLTNSVLSAQVQTSLSATSAVPDESGLIPGNATAADNLFQAMVFGNNAVSQASLGTRANPGGNVTGTWVQTESGTAISAVVGTPVGMGPAPSETSIETNGSYASILGNQMSAQAVGNNMSGIANFGFLQQSADAGSVAATVAAVSMDAEGLATATVSGNRASSAAIANSAAAAVALAGPITVQASTTIAQSSSDVVTATTGSSAQGVNFSAEGDVSSVSGNTAVAAARGDVANLTLQTSGIIGVDQSLAISQANSGTVLAAADDVLFSALGGSSANVLGNTMSTNAIGNLASSGASLSSATDGATLVLSLDQQQLEGSVVGALVGLGSTSIGMQAVDLASSTVLGNNVSAIAAANAYSGASALGNLNNAAAYFGSPETPLAQLASGEVTALVDWSTTGSSLFGSNSQGASVVANNSVNASAYLNSMVTTVQSAGLVASSSIGISTAQSVSSTAAATAQVGEMGVQPMIASANGNSALVAGNVATATALGNMAQNGVTVGALGQATGVSVNVSQANDGLQSAGVYGAFQSIGNQAVLTGNALNAAAQANMASNSITMYGPLNGGSANIAMNQTMTGGVSATVGGTLNAQGLGGTVVAGNSMTASAIGNQANNSITGASGYGVGSIGINTAQVATGSIVASVSGSVQSMPGFGAATVVGTTLGATAAGNVSISVITH